MGVNNFRLNGSRDRYVFYARLLLHSHWLDARLLVHVMLERREN